VAQPQPFVQAVRLVRLPPIGMAALIAWMPVVRVGNLVKDGAKRRRLRRSSILDKIANTNRVPSKRSRPLSGPLTCHSPDRQALTAIVYSTARAGLSLPPAIIS
jgi:hypothetical protein